MRKSLEKNDRPDRGRNRFLSPLMSAMLRAFRTLGSEQAGVRVGASAAPSQPTPLAAPAIRFEALEPRVLLSGDVNPAALSVNGAISTPGEKDQYQFTVEDTRRVVFDSLTNRSDLNWTLEGPAGQLTSRSFNATDYNAYSSPAFELKPGKYMITVDGQGDATGDYSLRIVDADAAADMTPGVNLTGTLDGGNKSAIYRFTATAGDKFYFKGGSVSGGSADWRLIDPFGRQEGGTYSLSSDIDTFALQRTGQYLVVVEGAASNTSPVNYAFNLRPVVDSTSSLALDTITTANIDQPGKTANFTFNLAKETPVLFDKLTNANYYWSLKGPQGVKVYRTSAADIGSYAGGYGRMWLAAGDYTLSIDTDGATTGSYAFQMLTADSAERLETGTVVSSSLDSSRGTKVYKVALTEGDKVFLDGRSVSGGTLSWRLVNPYGITSASGSSLTTLVDPFTVNATGDYWLVLDGADGNADATVSYQFAFNKVPDLAAALTLDTLVTGSVDLAGQATVYTFDLASASQLAFDAQTNRSDLNWSLSGPRGVEVSSRRFDQSDAASTLSALSLPPGSYKLTVRGSGRATPSYAFKVLDLAAGQPMTVGSALKGSLTPGNGTQAYRFTVAAGDKVAFQTNSVTGGNAAWRIIDCFGRDVAGSSNLAANRAAITLTQGGVYTLLIEGQLDNAAPVVFDVQFNAAGNQAPTPLPAGDALTVGALVAGTFTAWDATKTYRFTLASDALIVMDSQYQSGSSAIWSLVGPRGTEVNQAQIYTSDANYGYPVFSLPAGDYAMTVKGASVSWNFWGGGAYTFRLLDASTFANLTLGQQTTGTRSPSNATLGYRVEATAGSKLILNWSDSNYSSLWRLVDPFGRQVPLVGSDTVDSVYEISTTGVYTLLNESYYYAGGTSNVTFTLKQQGRAVAPLVLNDQASGTLAGRESLAQYDFTLDQSSMIVFDALDTTLANAGNIQWLLRGPRGTVTGWNSFTGDTNANYGLMPGKYSLVLRNTQNVAAGYKFRVLNRDVAQTITPGTAVNDTIPAGQTRLYRFNANAGDRYYFDGQNNYYATNEYCGWALIDPYGQTIRTGATYYDDSGIQLTAGGEYLLVVYPYTGYSSGANTPRNPKFNLLPKLTSTAALVLNQDIEGSIARPTETVKYGFTLTAPARILVDSWGSSTFYWGLTGPRGSEASGYGVGSAPRFFDLPAGNYEFAVAANDLSTGSYHFRLTDLASVDKLDINTDAHLSLASTDRSTGYRRIELTDTTQLLFDAIGTANPYANWALYDIWGNIRANGQTNNDSSRFTLAAGTYYLVLTGWGGTQTECNIGFRQPTVKTGTITLDSTVKDALDQPAQEVRYTLNVSSPTTLLFESLTNSGDLAWELTGPTGTLRYATNFNTEGVFTRINSAGTYTVRVFSRSNAKVDFGFRLRDLAAIPVQTLPGSQTLTLTPQNRTVIYAFDGTSGDYLSYQFGRLSQTASVQWYLVDAQGSSVVYPQDARYEYSRALGAGRYYLVMQGSLTLPESVDLTFRTLVVRNREFALALGSDSSGSIDASGQTETWTFTLDKDSRLLLDGLSNTRVSWMLTNGAGQYLGAGALADPALFNLAAGSYRIVINANNGYVPGSYSFRLIDTATASPLEEGAAAAGTLPATHAADVFRLSVAAGEAWYLQAIAEASGGRMRIFDPRGSLVAVPAFPEAGAEIGRGSQAGDYLVVVDSNLDNPNSLSYTLTAKRIQESFESAALGDTLSGAIAAPNEYRSYRISLATQQRLIVANAGSDSSIRWRIVPAGLNGSGWSTFPTDSLQNGRMLLNAGDYVLTVACAATAGANYRFRLLGLGDVPVVDYAGTNGELADGRDAVAYAFNNDKLQRIRVGITTADPSKLSWALFDNYGNSISSSATGISRDMGELSVGRYVLVLYGKGAATDVVDYTFAPTPIVPPALTLGETVNSTFPLSGDRVDYTFTLSARTTLLFDALAGASTFSYQIYNQWGSYVAGGTFDQDATAWSRLLTLDAGNYSVRITRPSTWGSTSVAAPYGFRVLSFEQTKGAALEYGVPLAGRLAGGTEVVAHQLDMRAGDYVTITPDSVQGGNVFWRLLDTAGNIVISAQSGSYSGLHITANGRYTLLIDGVLGNTGPVDYQFTVTLDRHVDTRPAGDILALGVQTTATIPATGSKTYRFSVAAPTLLVITGKTADGRYLPWRLQGVENTISNTGFGGAANNALIYTLAAGDYALTFDNSSNTSDASVDFLVEDAAHAQTASLGSDIVTTGPRLFKVSLNLGDYFFYRPATNSEWRLYDSAFNYRIWMGNQYNYNAYVPSQAGDYFIILANDYSAQPTNAKLEFRKFTDRTYALDLNAPVAGSSDISHSDSYTFTLAEPRQLLLDLSQFSGYVTWRLTSDGSTATQGTWNYSADSSSGSNPLLNLGAGNYRLTLQGNWSNPNPYSFRLFDLAQAPTAVLDGDTTVTLVPGQAAIRKFEARAGDSFVYMPITIRTDGTWRLVDGAGNTLYNGNSLSQEKICFNLPADGTYYLIWDTNGYSYSGTVAADSVFKTRVVEPSQPLVLANFGETMSGALGDDGGLRCQFQVNGAAKLYIDLLESGTVSAWTILNAQGGTVASGGTGTMDSLLASIYESGTYTLILVGHPFVGSAVGFRLVDIAAAATDTGTTGEVTGTVTSGAAVVYKVDVLAGQSVAYAAVNVGGATGRYAILNSSGGIVYSGYDISSGAVLRNMSAGTYYLLLDTDKSTQVPSVSYDLRFKVVTANDPVALNVGTTVNDTLGEDGQQRYQFTISSSSLLWLDMLNDQALSWQVTNAQGAWIASGGWSGSSGSLISVTSPGTYTLTITSGSALPASRAISFRLSDLASTAVAINTDTRVDGTLDPGSSTKIYQFNALSGDNFKFMSYSPALGNVNWRLYSQSGVYVSGGTLSSYGWLTSLSSYGAGRYYLIIDGSTANTSPVAYGFAASLNAVSYDTTYSGYASSYSPAIYHIHLDQPAWLAFDSQNQGYYTYWSLTGSNGQVFSASYRYDRDVMRQLAAGDYTLRVYSSYYWYSTFYQFRVMTQASAEALTLGSVVSGTLNPYATKLYRFDATAGDTWYFRALQGFSGNWRLIDPQGSEVFNASAYDSQDRVTLAKTGTYILAIEASNSYGAYQNYSFGTTRQPADRGAIALDTTASVTAAAAGVELYRLHLDRATTLVFDSLTSSNFTWRLDGPGGLVFNQSMNANTDFAGILAAGDYVLTVGNNNNTATAYSFRVLSLDGATPVVPGTQIDVTVTPPNGAKVYKFDAVAGERYYLDVLATLSFSSSVPPKWRLLDPQGRQIFGPGDMGYFYTESWMFDPGSNSWRYRYKLSGNDQELSPFTLTGTYTLILEGDNTRVSIPPVSFNVYKVPNNPPVILDTLVIRPAPDLALNSVVLDPSTDLKTGQTINVSWVVENRGLLAATGKWNDRILIRNLDTGALVASITVPYDEAVDGAIASGTSHSRSTLVRLPDGSAAAGRIGFTILTDADNVVREGNATGTSESNNAKTVETTVVLAPYPDLVVENLVFSPAGDFQPGQAVDVTWTTANRGDIAVDHPWSERIEVRNLSTNQLVAVVSLRDELTEGSLGVGQTRQRAARFNWPTGVSASGRFSIRIIADSSGEIGEANTAGTGESNNTTEVIRTVGPDLQIRNLQLDSTDLQAGGLVTVRWEDWNLGASATGAAFEDHIVVRNNSANLVLLDTSLTYDPNAIVNGQSLGGIPPGQYRERSFTFRLPDGIRGTGSIGITVTADQNAGGIGVLYETNLTNNAETNNSAGVQATAAPRPYADLRISAFDSSTTGVGGEPVTVSWTVANNGQALTSAAWNDQVIFSNDSIIGNADDVVIGTIRHTGALAVGGSYSQTATLRVPMRPEGRYYLGIKTDSGSEVVEPDTRADNVSVARAIDLAAAYSDLNVLSVSGPTTAQSGENIQISWDVRNDGNATTDLALWNDRVVLSTDGTLSGDDIILAGSVTHAGLIGPGQGYTGRATVTLPRDLSGDYYIIVDTNTNRTVTELGRTGNNTRASTAVLRIGLAPCADLTVADVSGPAALRPGDSATITYTASNAGGADATGAWRDRVYIDQGASGLYEVGSVLISEPLAAGASATRTVNVTIPTSFTEGDYHWVVKTDTDNTIYERNADNNNQASSTATVRIARVDLAVTEVRGPGLAQSGNSIHVEWTVANQGGAALGNWVDQVFLVKGGVQRKFAEVAHASGLATGASYSASADFAVPLEYSGEYDVLVISDAAKVLDDSNRTDNQTSGHLTVELAPYADLAVTAISAPETTIADPASLNVSWTVSNQGTGEGRTSAWTDRVILSKDDTFGNGDDWVVGEFRHTGALAAGESYTRSERILLPANTSARYKLFVVSDTKSEVFENYSEANNVGRVGHDVDIMPIPYADLQVASVTATGTAASGRSMRVTWEVVNNGIGITNTADWSDSVWLSRNPDGSGMVANFGSAGHVGQLAQGDRYSRSLDVTLPEGIEGTFYFNVSTSGPFEFIFNNNNRGTSVAIPVTLSKSPDLTVENVTLPATAKEGALIDVSWTVVNQGEAAAAGLWVDSVWLVPASGTGNWVPLGNFTYDRGLDSGIRYTRTEQVRLPSKIEGLYRVRVVTNANLGGSGSQVYEYGAARSNNGLTSADTTEVSMYDRPDLRVATVTVPEHVTAGTSAAIRYTISNMGAAVASGRWTDKVYLSLDANLSGDDRLVGEFGNGGALAPSESYANETAMVDIPIRFRGDAYLIVVADGNNNVDEYPNDGNNVRVAHFYVDPVPFGDLVTSNVVAPDQAVHGASIEVRYKVTNQGSATTRGDSAALNTWTDTVWLARDKRRPGAYKGDILLGSFTHVGNLGVGEDYLGTAQVTLPDNVASGQYYITVWSDTYDVILEDTLATNINPDDPSGVDNNNYKARPISVLGITPPDLIVSDVSAPPTGAGGGSYTFSYTVQNRGDAFSGNWRDSVYLTENADGTGQQWSIGDYTQSRGLGNGERYTVTQTVQLAPSVKGRYLFVRSDSWGQVGESNEGNNTRSASSLVTVLRPADLQVTEIRTQPSNYSGEETTVTWTVTNLGGPVWSGTRSWIDAVYLSRDPSFIPERATPLGTFVHANVDGLAEGASYTTSAKLRLPAGTDGDYYIYVITDHNESTEIWQRRAKDELLSGGSNDYGKYWYGGGERPGSAWEELRKDNNIARQSLAITYREPDLKVGNITVSEPTPLSGQPITVTWTVTNQGTRETRTNSWYDGIYLSRDASLDYGDYALVDRGSQTETALKVRAISLSENGKPKYLKPGESYTASATFNLPESISGDFHLIVKTDTTIFKDPWNYERSTIRDGLIGLARVGDPGGTVLEFQDEGNNVTSIDLPIVLATPPDLQVAEVTAPASVLAGQNFTVTYRVVNQGGDTPSDQTSWNDLIYLSKDRFLDVNQDRYLGYIAHNGGLAASGSYGGSLTVTAPRNLEGPYYVFVVTDPARTWGTGDYGRVREFGREQNNATAAAQPIILETPPPADLKVTNVTLPASAKVGDEVRISYTVANDSINTAYGRWTDALYLSSDNSWDLGDVLIGKVDHVGDLAGGGSYSGTLTAKLPPLKDGNWRIIVRPDLYNEVFEGKITYTATGLNLPPGEANNRIASGSTLQVIVPVLQVASPLATTLSPGEARLYKVSVAAGETLRVSLDAAADEGANELYVRYGDIPTGYAFDAAYSNPVATDQQAMIGTTKAGDYYILVRSRQGAAGVGNSAPVTLRADLLPLSITKITPDQGGTGDDDHRWVTFDIYGSHFKAGALVKLVRPGVYEAEPERWQVLDATHIRAVFDMRKFPHGLYDVTVINPDGERVTEAQRYLVERGIEADVTIGIGGPRTLSPGENGLYSVSLQSLTNVDTPYVRFDIGAPEMGYSEDVLGGLNLPYVVFGTNIGGRPDGATVDAAGNTQSYGQTPTTGTARPEIPWASLDGVQNTSGFNLAPGYAFDVQAGGFIGATFNIQTYPGLAEWLAHDFEGLRDKLYAVRPDWKEQGLLDGGVQDLDKIAPGLTEKFLHVDQGDDHTHITKLEALAMPFRFNVLGAATPLTRDEFIADQTKHAKQLRAAILADTEAPASLSALAADEGQWVDGWLGALESAGLLRPLDEAPPIRDNPKVVSLNATLATGILLAKGGDSYRTQADILGFFAKVQQWYGDTAKYAGDLSAAKAAIEYKEVRQDDEGDYAEIPVPVMADPADFDLNAAHETHFINFNIFAGGQTELEYLRHIGVLDDKFNPIGGQALNLTQYLQQAADQNAAAQALVSVRGPQAVLGEDGSAYVPAATPLPYTVSFSNPTETPAGQIRIVTQLDPDLDPRSLRLGDLKIGDINVHLPGDKANFQGDFDFSGSKGFVLRVSAGVDASTGIATWLLQAIDPDTGEVLHDATRGLLAKSDRSQASVEQQKRGFATYTVSSADTAVSGAEIAASARVIIDDAPPVDSETISAKLDAAPPHTALTVTALGNDAQGAPTFDVQWTATDDASGVKSVTVYVAEDGGDFKIWQRQVAPEQTKALFTGVAGKHYEFLAVAIDKAGNREAASVANAVLPDDGARQEVLDALGVNETVTQTAEMPLAAPDRSYPANDLFEQSTQQLPGQVARIQTSDLRSVLAPFTLRGFADGFAGSAADIGAQALVELPGGGFLASAGTLRNEVYRYAKEGGHSVSPLFTLDAPVLDMAVDNLGQLWVMTGAELLQVDADSGAILQRLKGPGGDPLTHALAIHPQTGEIYVSSGSGIEIYNPAETRPARAWRHFSNQRVGDLAFGPDGRLWGVKWSGSDITGAALNATTDIVSFPLSGRSIGRPELEYRLSGLIDSIGFGAAGTALEGLLVASSNLKQRPVVEGAGETPHQSSVWMIELASQRALQVAAGGTRGESIIATRDGRILVAESGRIDEIAPRRAPVVKAVTVPDGALMPLPLTQIGVVFDQAMWQGEAGDTGSVLNPDNFTLTVLGAQGGAASLPTFTPQGVRWDAATRTAWLDVTGLAAGQYQLDIHSTLQSEVETRLDQDFVSTFTALLDMSSQVRLDFTHTRANRATGEISYDVSVTNIGTDDLKGPVTLLLDPGRYFEGSLVDASEGAAEQSKLWTLDLTAALAGGKLAAGATLAGQTVTITPLSRFAPRAGMADLVKANLGHGIYAVPQDNLPPQLGVAGGVDPDGLEASLLPDATVGQPWRADLEAIDPDGTRFYWQLVQAPAGVTLSPSTDVTSSDDGYHNLATLSWTPTARADANSEIVVRVQDSRGGVAFKRFQLAVAAATTRRWSMSRERCAWRKVKC